MADSVATRYRLRNPHRSQATTMPPAAESLLSVTAPSSMLRILEGARRKVQRIDAEVCQVARSADAGFADLGALPAMPLLAGWPAAWQIDAASLSTTIEVFTFSRR